MDDLDDALEDRLRSLGGGTDVGERRVAAPSLVDISGRARAIQRRRTGLGLSALVVAVVIVVAVVSGTGRREPDPSVYATDPPPAAAGTTPATLPPRSCAPDPSIFPIDPNAPAPPLIASDLPDPADSGTTRADRDRILVYTAAHPDEFSGTVSLHGPERYAVAFTADLDIHRAAILGLVEHPERILVVLGCATEAEITAVSAEVGRSVSNRAGMAGDPIGGFVAVDLPADLVDRADGLLERYGDRVVVTVGGKPYPRGSPRVVGLLDRSMFEAEPCPPLDEQPDRPMPDLEITPIPRSPSVGRGQDLGGSLEVVNRGRDAITIHGGQPSVALVVERGTRTVVATYVGAIFGTGLTKTLGPGESTTTTFIGSTGDCRPDGDYALPAGEYGLIVPFTVDYTDYGTPDVRPVVQWSTEVTITITDG